MIYAQNWRKMITTCCSCLLTAWSVLWWSDENALVTNTVSIWRYTLLKVKLGERTQAWRMSIACPVTKTRLSNEQLQVSTPFCKHLLLSYSDELWPVLKGWSTLQDIDPFASSELWVVCECDWEPGPVSYECDVGSVELKSEDWDCGLKRQYYQSKDEPV